MTKFMWGAITAGIGSFMFLLSVFAWNPILGLMLFSAIVIGAGAFLMLDGED